MMPFIQPLLGTWFVCSSNFPMWLKGDKTNPTFTYSITDKKASTMVLRDEVKYMEQGKLKTLAGFDYQDKTDSSTFVWRGTGLLSLVRSKWKIILIDPAGQWAVIWFSKTLFTPEGVDIISRTPTISTDTQSHIFALMANDLLLAKLRASLRPIIHK